MDVYVLIITHDYENYVEAHETMESALDSLDDYVKNDWEDPALGEIPDDREERFDVYFTDNDTEWWSLESCTVQNRLLKPQDAI